MAKPQLDLNRGSEPDLHSLLKESLDGRVEKYLMEVRRCQKRCSEKAVHDLRVATRRLISTLDLVSTVLVDRRLEKVRGQLKKRLRLLGPLRDVQVHLLWAEKMRGTYPEIEPFFTMVLLRERRLLKNIERLVQNLRPKLLARELSACTDRLSALLESPAMRSVAVTATIGVAASAFAKAVALRRAVDAFDPRTIHRLRVSFKKFRYVAEVLQPILPGITAKTLKSMNAYQVKMGDIQDIEVLTATFNEFATRLRKHSSGTFLRVHQELAREHERLVNAFVESADDLYGFWEPRHLSSVTAQDHTASPAA